MSKRRRIGELGSRSRVESDWSVCRCLEALDPSLQVGKRLFQFADAPIELGVGELDHRLRLGKAAVHPLLDVVDSAIQLFFDVGDHFRLGLNLLLVPSVYYSKWASVFLGYLFNLGRISVDAWSK